MRIARLPLIAVLVLLLLALAASTASGGHTGDGVSHWSQLVGELVSPW